MQSHYKGVVYINASINKYKVLKNDKKQYFHVSVVLKPLSSNKNEES